MAGRGIRKEVHDLGHPQNRQLSQLRSYQDLSKNEVDRVNSALEAAASFGQPETLNEDLKSLNCSTSDKEDIESKDINLEAGDSDAESAEAPTILKRSCPFGSELDEESETESPSDSSKRSNRNLFTITLNRKNRHRLETALKLLEFVEGGGNDSDSDLSLNSSESSFTYLSRVRGKTSTPRLQALKDRTRKDY